MEEFAPVGLLRAAIARADASEVARLLEAHAWSMLAGHLDELRAAFALLEPHVIEASPALRIFHRGIAMSTGEGVAVHSSGHLLENGQRIGSEMIVARARGEHDRARGLADELEIALQQIGSYFPVRPLDIAKLNFQLGMTRLMLGDSLRALYHFTAAERLSVDEDDGYLRRDALVKMAIVHAYRGMMWDAESSLAASLALPEVPPFFAGFIATSERVARGLLDVENISAAPPHSLTALSGATVDDELWPFIMLVKCRAALALGNPSGALELVHTMTLTRLIERGSLAEDIRTGISMDAHLLMGDVAAAEQLDDAPAPAGWHTTLARARLMMYDGRVREAADAVLELQKRPGISASMRDECALLAAFCKFIESGGCRSATSLHVANIAAARPRIATTIPEEFAEAVRAALPARVAAEFARNTAGLHFAPYPSTAMPSLSQQDVELLHDLALGRTNQQIAQKLAVSPHTVKTRLAVLFRKLSVGKRADAVRVATQAGLMSQHQHR